MSDKPNKEEIRRKKARAIADKLDKLAKQADDLELTLLNGGLVGNMLGVIADDLRLMTSAPKS
jgi:hypothetical protein